MDIIKKICSKETTPEKGEALRVLLEKCGLVFFIRNFFNSVAKLKPHEKSRQFDKTMFVHIFDFTFFNIIYSLDKITDGELKTSAVACIDKVFIRTWSALLKHYDNKSGILQRTFDKTRKGYCAMFKQSKTAGISFPAKGYNISENMPDGNNSKSRKYSYYEFLKGNSLTEDDIKERKKWLGKRLKDDLWITDDEVFKMILRNREMKIQIFCNSEYRDHVIFLCYSLCKMKIARVKNGHGSVATIISCLYCTDKTKVNIIPKNFISNLKKNKEKYYGVKTSVNRIIKEMQKIFN